MDSQDQHFRINQEIRDRRQVAGIFLVLIGGMILLKQFGFYFFPSWIFSWPLLLIALGIYSGVRHQFRNNTWLILILVGSFFLFNRFAFFGFGMHRFSWPLLIAAIGLVILIRPPHTYRRTRDNWDRPANGDQR